MWLKNFRRRKAQTVLLFVIIFLCSMLLTAALDTMTNIKQPFDVLANETNAASMMVYMHSEKSNINEIKKNFESLPEVDRTTLIKYHPVTEKITYQNKKIEAFMNLTEFQKEFLGKARIKEGTMNTLSHLKDGECAIPICISVKYDIHIGDKIQIHYADRIKSYEVKAVYTNAYTTSTSFDCYIVISKLSQNTKITSDLMVWSKSDPKGETLADRYREKYKIIDGEIFSLLEAKYNNLITANICGGIFLAIGGIMLLVSGLIINFMVRSTMLSDAKKIAVYKTIGYTSGEIEKMYLTFYFVVTSLASIMGIIASKYISDLVLTSFFDNMGAKSNGVNWISNIFCYLVVVIFVLSIISFLIHKTKGVKPVYALNGWSLAHTKKNQNQRFSFSFSPIGIALRDMVRDHKSVIGIIFTSIFTIFSINFAIISLDVALHQREQNNYWLGIDASDYIVEVTKESDFDSVQKITKSQPDIKEGIASRRHTFVGLEQIEGSTISTMSCFSYSNYDEVKLPVVEGTNPSNQNEIAISSKVAKNFDKKVGDYLTVYLEEDQPVDLLISGIYQTYYQLGDSCRLRRDAYTSRKIPLQYNSISIYLKEGTDHSAFVKEMKRALGKKATIIKRTDAYASIMSMIVDPQTKVIPPVMGLVLLIGATNIFCIVMLKNAKSKRRNGIYKTLGYTNAQIMKSNMYYVLIIAAVSMAIAVPAILLLYPKIMLVCIGMFGFIEYPVLYLPGHILAANLGVLFIFVVTAYLSSRSIRKIDVRELVED
ncbi:ABC transporter, permease protein [Lachnospiraceae bacterium KM106-2]|nr:ABC transporter, permease protein [Lachnospiraceae bacterium KM106-2]